MLFSNFMTVIIQFSYKASRDTKRKQTIPRSVIIWDGVDASTDTSLLIHVTNRVSTVRGESGGALWRRGVA